MSPRIINCEQGTPEWFQARMGLPTASMFGVIPGFKKEAKDKKTRRDYMFKLAGEIIGREPMPESYTNDHMKDGKEKEDDARRRYAFEYDADPVQVGFVVNGRAGCSPDSLLGNNGILEIKRKLPYLLLDLHLSEDDYFPPEHMAQCQGNLWVTEREYVDLAVYYSPRYPLVVKKLYRNEVYILQLVDAIRQFNAELDELVEQIRRRGGVLEAA